MEAAPNRWNGLGGDLRYASGCYAMSIPGASAVGLGSGKSNTEAIVSACPESNIAAKIADDLVLNGKSDWFLPSRDELNAMYPHRAGIGIRIAENNQVYASSTFPNADTFAAQMFTTDSDTGFISGRQFSVERIEKYSYYVRPIRYVEYVDPFPTKPLGRSPIWKNSERELHKWELGIMRYLESSTTPDTYLAIWFPSGDSFGNCSEPSQKVRFGIFFAHDMGSSPVYRGITGSVERCSYSAVNFVSVFSGRFGTQFFGTDGDRFLNDFPKGNLDNGVPVVFWVRLVGEHPHIGFRTDSGWIKVDLRSWPYQRT